MELWARRVPGAGGDLFVPRDGVLDGEPVLAEGAHLVEVGRAQEPELHVGEGVQGDLRLVPSVVAHGARSIVLVPGFGGFVV